MSSDYHADSLPSEQESYAVLLGENQLPPKVHLRLCIDCQTYTRYDQEECSLQLGEKGKRHILSYQVGNRRSTCTIQLGFQQRFLALHIRFQQFTRCSSHTE